MFSTEEVFQIAEEAEVEIVAKKAHERPRKRSISPEVEADVENILEIVSNDSVSDFIIVAGKRSN